MGEARLDAFRAQLVAAAGWEPGKPVEPVLEAVAGAVGLELTGDLSRVAAADRERLRKIGQRALLHVGAVEDEDELEALRLAAALAREGLRALSGREVEDRPSLAVRIPIAPEEIAQFLAGRLDGLAAASLALRVRSDPRARAELTLLLELQAPEQASRIPLAAADAAAVLDPSQGRVVGEWAALGVEAVLFAGDPCRLALYSVASVALRLEGAGIATEEVRAGYWLGRLSQSAGELEATLHAGERSEPFRIVLS